jgi:hypothetical protein
MISTVTTSTVTIVTTVAVASSLALVSIITLLVLLIQREMMVRLGSAGDLDRKRHDTASSVDGRLVQGLKPFTVLSRVLIIGILPLLMAFILIVGVKVAEVLK